MNFKNEVAQVKEIWNNLEEAVNYMLSGWMRLLMVSWM